ncbi:MAG TPA: AAA family ATPase [Phaeodactylibacter sp.]|nr:AAA family ATPase [Phaeodactylibacter sp.]
MTNELQPLQLNGDFKAALDLLEKTNTNLFITGRAGTGKSTLLQLFRNTTHKKVVVLAPTGIAALNVNGVTIHSFFRFPAKPISRSEVKRVRYRKLYQKLDVVIIDEISMVRADMIDNMDAFLRLNANQPGLPFGGVQMVFFGDLFQLPPVVSSPAERQLFQSFYDSPYFFSAKVFENNFEMEMLELRQIYRQNSRHFVRLLDAVRLKQIDYDDLDDLNERCFPDFKSEDFYITLSPRNATVDAINERELKKLNTEDRTYMAKVQGNFAERRFPVEALLKLKLGAQVMFVKNDPDRKFVNGTIGKIVELEPDAIKVLIEDENGIQKTIKVVQLDWEILRYNLNEKNEITTEVMGSYKQYPLRLAWAVTIHKSQGKTFDKIIIDMGKGAFESGQTYVALSRCRTLQGIVLKSPLTPKDIITDDRIVEFYERGR